MPRVRSVSGVVAALILLLMFVGTVALYMVFIGAQTEVYRVQMEAARLAEEVRRATRALLLYYNTSNTTGGVELIVTLENRGSMPVTISGLLLAYGYGSIEYDVVAIANNTDSDAPTFQRLAQLLYETAGVEPRLNITLYTREGVATRLSSLPATIAPGERLVVEIGPLPLDFRVYTVVAEASFALPGGGVVAQLVTPQATGGVVVVQQVYTPPLTTGGGGGGLTAPECDQVVWVYGIPVSVKLSADRVDWPVAILVNFTKLGIDYLVDPRGVRVMDEDNGVWVPVNVTQLAPNYMLIVFPVTGRAGETRNYTIFAAGGPLYHPEGFYPVGLARLWNGSIVWRNGVTYYASPATGSLLYIILEAPAGTLTPLDEASLSTIETEVAPESSVTLPTAIPYFDTSLTSLYVHADVRLNETLGVDTAPPTASGLHPAYASLAPAWLSAWKYKVLITVYNPTTVALTNALVYIDAGSLPTPTHLFQHARSDGGDIVFVDESTGTMLDFVTLEYDPVNQVARWIVKIPSLGPGEARTIALYYGNPLYNKSLETLASNLTHLYRFLSDIQPPGISGVDYYYVPIDLPLNTWDRVYASSNYATPNITLGDDGYTLLPGGFTFPFYETSYDTSQLYVMANGFISPRGTSDYTPTTTEAHWYGGVFMFWTDIYGADVYINSTYYDELGAGYLVRLYSDYLYGRRAGPVNTAAILYANGLIRLVYGDMPNGAASTTPYVYIGVAEGSNLDYTDYYYGYTANFPDYHNDILFVPTFDLIVGVSAWMPAVHAYNATLSLAQVSRGSGGFVVFHWKSDEGLYSAEPVDILLWLSYTGDILLDIVSMPLAYSGWSGAVVVGFSPGSAAAPSLVFYSTLDGIATLYNFTGYPYVALAKEVLLLRNDSYTVTLGKAVPRYPWVTCWEHGLRVTIHNPNSFNLYNYTLLVRLGAGNLTSDYLQSSLFGRDLRVLDEEGRRIPFWVQTADPNQPLILVWVKVPFIPAGGNATIYIYYGATGGFTVVDESDPYKTMIAYLEAGQKCPDWPVYATTSYTCVERTLPGYPTLTLVSAYLEPGDIIRFYSNASFGISGVFGYEVYAELVPNSDSVEYDVAVELVQESSYNQPPSTAGSYGVVFGSGSIARLVGGELNSTWDQGSVTYTKGYEYSVLIRINGTTMVTRVYSSVSGLIASATDTITVNDYYRAAVLSHAVSLSGVIEYSVLRLWVRTWVYNEPYVAASALLA